MEEIYKVVSSKPGVVVLADGSKLILRAVIVGVKYTGVSPFGGVNFTIKTAGGVSSLYVPAELKERIRDRPLFAPDKFPEEGWELVNIERQDPAVEEIEVIVREKRYHIEVLATASMVSRNMNYKTDIDEPLYWVAWSTSIRWWLVG